MKFFSIPELCKSSDATKYGISNNPSPVIQDHLTQLVDNLLDPIREKWGSGITINSGYRSPELNRRVGGSTTSAHCGGYAADTKPSNGNMAAYQRCVLEWAATHKFDQIIIEYPTNYVAKWIHVAIKNNAGLQRRQILFTTNGKSYPPVPSNSQFYKV